MSQQYLRNLSLIVADPSGEGLELGALRDRLLFFARELQAA